MADFVKPQRFGWLPDYPSIKDYTPKSPQIQKLFKDEDQKPRSLKSNIDEVEKKLGTSISNRKWCTNFDQLDIGSCTACGCLGMYEYLENKSYGRHTKLSELFLYKVTRRLIGLSGDTGAYIRSAIGGLKLFGAPPAQTYPYHTPSFDNEPDAYSYAFAQNFQAIQYFKFDKGELATDKNKLIVTMKDWISRGYTMEFGFTVYDSYADADRNGGKLPYPSRNENVQGGHAVQICGYDDNKAIENPRDSAANTVGAFEIRNSWGTSWGDRGFGWIPYKYFETGLADDIWSLTRAEFIDTRQFNYE